jgi:hypothetical protein
MPLAPFAFPAGAGFGGQFCADMRALCSLFYAYCRACKEGEADWDPCQASYTCAKCHVCRVCHDKRDSELGHAFERFEYGTLWPDIIRPYVGHCIQSGSAECIMNDCVTKISAIDAENELGILHLLLATGDMDYFLRDLLELGINPDVPFCPVYKRSMDVTAVTSKRATYVTCDDLFGGTAVHFAAYYGREKCLKLLLEVGADVDVKTIKKARPDDLSGVAENIRQMIVSLSR